MGSKQSKQQDFGLGHPERFYEGCAAVQNGSYTISEVYFNQAMAQHPGHAFWTSLMDVTIMKSSPPTEVASPTTAVRPGSPGTLPSVLKTEEELGTTVFRDGDKDGAEKGGESGVPESGAATAAAAAHSDANLSVDGPPSESESVPTLVLPVDHRLVDVPDYVRMLTDIGRVYIRKAGGATGESREMSCRLSMLYNAYTSVRLQALLTVLREHFAAHSTEEDGSGEDMFRIYARRTMNAQWGGAAFKTEGSRRRASAVDAEVNMGSQDPIDKGTCDSTAGDKDVCVMWEFMQFLFSVNVLSYAMSALRLCTASDYAMSPATQKAVLDMALRCFDVVERDLSLTAEANAPHYFGGLMKKFVALLSAAGEECRVKEEAVASFGLQRHGHSKQAERTVKDPEAKFIRLGGGASFTDQQRVFLRTAMRFPVMTLPLLDCTALVPMKMVTVGSGNHHREAKWMTPVERPFGWYMSFGLGSAVEQRAGKPGNSVFLLQKCGVVPGATMKDANFFTCVGLEEFSLTTFALAFGTVTILDAVGKKERAQELATATNQFALDVYGGPTPLSEAMKSLVQRSDDGTTF